MIPSDKIQPAMEDRGVDAVVASTAMHVFYTTGLVTSTTVTPHHENFEETGYYYDTPASPPKNLSVWTREHDRPILVIAPNESGQLPNLDIEEAFVYMPEGFGGDDDDDDDGESEADPEVVAALANSYDTIYEALGAAVDGLVADGDTVAIEGMSLSPTVTQHVEDALPTTDVVEATGLFHELRLTKTDAEVARLKAAARANEAAIEDAIAELEAGMTEEEFANVYRQKQTEHGATHRHTHIGFGPNSAHGHVVPGEREIQPGDLVRFEVGCFLASHRPEFEHRLDPRQTFYPGDLARTYAFQEVDPTFERQYEVIHAAMKRLESLMTDGASAGEVHEAALARGREVAREVGATELEDWTSHMSGHNVGLDCHDHPLLSTETAKHGDDTLRAGMVMNWELAHLVQGVGGIQLEETGLVTEDGLEAYTASPETLLVVG